jgi:hypothetical protein
MPDDENRSIKKAYRKRCALEVFPAFSVAVVKWLDPAVQHNSVCGVGLN